MIHRDYLLEMIAEFVDVVMESLGLALRRHDPSEAVKAEAALADLLDLDPELALRLSPDSLVTMMVLSGIGEALAEYATYVLVRLAEAYDKMGDAKTADLRRAQAQAVSESFGCSLDVVPREFEDFECSQHVL